MKYLLDTDVVSEARRHGANVRVVNWLRSVPSADLYLSVLVLGEIRRGIERLQPRDPSRAAVLDAWLGKLSAGYGDRLVAVDLRVAQEWGRINAAVAVPAVDGLLAATAQVHDMTLVRRNVADVARTGVRTLDPWDG